MLLLERFHRQGEEKDRVIFIESLLATAVGIGSGLLLFPAQASLVALFLVAWTQGRTVGLLMDRNRQDIWILKKSSAVANGRLAQSLLVLFLGVFITYGLVVQLAPTESLKSWFGPQLGHFVSGDMRKISFGDTLDLLSHNWIVFFGGFLFALIYRDGGMLLVLAWNASRWGVIFSYLSRTHETESIGANLGYLSKTMACVLPHLILEAMAYILVAMAGVFLSKALSKYALSSPQFAQVGRAVLQIAAIAAACLILAATVEARLAPLLVKALF